MDVPLSIIHSGGGCGCFLPQRKTLARDHNACSRQQSPLKYSSHNFFCVTICFQQMVTFLRGEQSCKRNMILLVAMGTEMDEDVSWFTGCLVCVCVCVWVNLHMPHFVCMTQCTYSADLYSVCMYHICMRKSFYIEFLSEQQILPSLNFCEGYYENLLSERSARFQEGIIS